MTAVPTSFSATPDTTNSQTSPHGDSTAPDRPSTSTSTITSSSKLVMQIIVRRDLLTVSQAPSPLKIVTKQELRWPVGSVIAQATHAATAVIHIHAFDPIVRAYLKGDDGLAYLTMRKVVLEVAGEKEMQDLAERLEGLEPRIPFHLWVEQP